jgi:hypothetical protein
MDRKGQANLDSAALPGHSLRRGAISSGVAQGVHIARFKQCSPGAVAWGRVTVARC